MTPKLSWNKTCFYVDGVPTSLISGEFPYFRVPKKDWRVRLELLKASGANAVATYIPWIIHEPEEGNILFDDIPERSLSDFLKLCGELDFMVIARPGPYSYSELHRDGLPLWLADNYPEILSYGPKGEYQKDVLNASYLHPKFLEKARKYIREVDRILKPFLVTNGGCIVSVQADNEIGGIHLWRGYVDCNAEAMGFGKADGYYTRFIEKKYGSIELLNERYGTDFGAFCDVLPFKNTPNDRTVEGKRFLRDYQNFYKWVMEEYVRVICEWFCEDGINVDYCTNIGNPFMIPLMKNIAEQNKQYNFFMGVDHYYSLSAAAGTCMTPERAIKYGFSLDMLEAIGMPPSVLELQSGSVSDYPSVLPENLSSFYMAHVAHGMKGSNYYIFTGGPNYNGTGCTTDVYDFQAPISATGQVRPIYYAQKERNEFTRANSWLLTANKRYDVQFGFNWELIQQTSSGPWSRYSEDDLDIKAYTVSVQNTLSLGARLMKCREIGDELDTSVPLVVLSDRRMSEDKQQALIDFVKHGGKLLLSPVVPEYDEEFLPCTLLKDFLGVKETVKLKDDNRTVILNSGERVFDTKQRFSFEGFGGESLAKNEADGSNVIEYKQISNGKVVLMGVTFTYSHFCQMDMVELCLQVLGAERLILTDCRDLIFTLIEGGDRAMCFLINSLVGKISTNLTVRSNGKEYKLGDVTVPAMSVLPIELM